MLFLLLNTIYLRKNVTHWTYLDYYDHVIQCWAAGKTTPCYWYNYLHDFWSFFIILPALIMSFLMLVANLSWNFFSLERFCTYLRSILTISSNNSHFISTMCYLPLYHTITNCMSYVGWVVTPLVGDDVGAFNGNTIGGAIHSTSKISFISTCSWLSEM